MDTREVAPLDLRAVEARLNGHSIVGIVPDAKALFAHCRALRAVLQEIVDVAESHGEVSTGELDDAVRVLAQATDAEAGPA